MSRALDRWKLATCLLALATAVLGYRLARPPVAAATDGLARDAAAPVAGGRAATVRRLRLAARATGMSEEAVLAELERTRSTQRLAVLCERLGFVGTDRALPALARLAEDPRRGVAELAIEAIGRIGSDEAVDRLLALEAGTVRRLRVAALAGLGATPARRARERLLALAATRSDPLRLVAVRALGEQGDDATVLALAELPREDVELMRAVVAATAAIGSPAAEALLVELAGSSDGRVRSAALDAMPGTADLDAQAALMDVLASGDASSAAAAAGALGRSGSELAVPLLAELARGGAPEARAASVRALGEIGGDEATAALAALVRDGGPLVWESAGALAQLATPAARAGLLAAADGHGDRSAVLLALGQLGGPDVDRVLLDVVRRGRTGERQAALQQLAEAGHPDVTRLAIELARAGGRSDRGQALALLAASSDPAARGALLDVARSSRGAGRGQALELLAQARPDDPEVTAMLVDAFAHGRGDEASMASYTLARLGTEPARAALLAGLASPDQVRRRAALQGAGQLLGDPELRDAVAQLARGADPEGRRTAVEHLLQAGDPEAVALARDAMRGEGGGALLYGVTQLGGEAGRALLREAFTAADPELRRTAANAVAMTGNPGSVDELARLAGDADDGVRQAALSSLGQLGSTAAVDRLLEASRGAPADRSAAAQALAYADDPRASGALAALIGDRDPEVALAAANAAGNADGQVDAALLAALGRDEPGLRQLAAQQLRDRGVALTGAQRAIVDQLLGPRPGE